jgi:hypothetical protein
MGHPDANNAKSLQFLFTKIASVAVAALPVITLMTLTNPNFVGASPNLPAFGRIDSSPSLTSSDAVAVQDNRESTLPNPPPKLRRSILSSSSLKGHSSVANRKRHSSSFKELANSHAPSNKSTSGTRDHKLSSPKPVVDSPLLAYDHSSEPSPLAIPQYASSLRSRMRGLYPEPLQDQHDKISSRDSSGTYSLIDSHEGHSFFE